LQETIRRLSRQVTLERLSTPERLDALMEVTTPRGWLVLLALVLAVLAAIAWGVFGAVPETVSGRGLMVKRAGLHNVESPAAGVVRDFRLAVGDTVYPDQVLGRLVQPELENSLRQARERLTEALSNRDVTRGLLDRDAQLERASIAQQRRKAEQAIESARARIAFLEETLRAHEELLRTGLMTREAHAVTVQQRAEARGAVAGAESELKELAAREASIETRASRSVQTLEQVAADARRQIEMLESQLRGTATIKSPHAGRVLELLTGDGAFVQAAQPLVTLERTDAPLTGLTFIGSEAKQVGPGMRVQMSPSGVAWEEYGFLLGRVTSVSESPLSPTAMNVLLHNDSLVRDFTSRGPAYVVAVDLELDRATPSGFRWTSHGGPDLKLGGGTLFDAKVTLRERRPIALMIPALRRWLGV